MGKFSGITLGAVVSLALATFSSAQGIAVDSITYTGVGGTGSYDDVTFMGSGESNECTKVKKEYSGSLAPFNEDLSLQFRGPLNLKQFAVYYPASSPSRRSNNFRRHGHRHAHHHKRDGSYARSAYYNAADGTYTGVTFMNTNGGSGSGVWSSAFGNSLSFSNEDNSGAASGPTCLKDMTIASDQQFNIFSDQQCDEATCGYTREGVPSYKGFAGGDKLFMFEFSMPKAAGGSGNNYDMPAIWALNGKITRMSQWSTCSCWESGCGEFDIFEAISTDTSDQLITHIHNNQGATGGNKGGSGSDGRFYFQRPTGNTMKAAVLFTSDGTIDIHVLDGSVEFSETIDTGSIKSSGSNIVAMPA